eukprot:SAG25_NODE_728_length_5697_cov_2.400322_3_plen_47_part_00
MNCIDKSAAAAIGDSWGTAENKLDELGRLDDRQNTYVSGRRAQAKI